MVIIALVVFLWPYIFGIGLLLRSFIYTKKIGGLIIAITIGLVLILPTINIIEYDSFTNGNLQPIGANTLPNLNIYEDNVNTGNIIVFNAINPYILPNVTQVINYYGCYPIFNNIYAQELIDAGLFLVPISWIFGLISILVGTSTTITLPNIGVFACQYPNNALNAVYALMNVYGYTSVAGFLLPILNFIIVLSAVMGLSGLIGGETDLGLLSRLI